MFKLDPNVLNEKYSQLCAKYAHATLMVKQWSKDAAAVEAEILGLNSVNAVLSAHAVVEEDNEPRRTSQNKDHDGDTGFSEVTG